MKQWKCGHCGAWVDACWDQHNHIQQEELPSIDELIKQRRIEEMGGAAASVSGSAPVVKYWRTFKEPTREAPDGR